MGFSRGIWKRDYSDSGGWKIDNILPGRLVLVLLQHIPLPFFKSSFSRSTGVICCAAWWYFLVRYLTDTYNCTEVGNYINTDSHFSAGTCHSAGNKMIYGDNNDDIVNEAVSAMKVPQQMMRNVFAQRMELINEKVRWSPKRNLKRELKRTEKCCKAGRNDMFTWNNEI